MRTHLTLAALLAIAIGAATPGPVLAQAADLVVQGRVGDVFVGIDTRGAFGWPRGHGHHGHHHHRGRRHVDPFDPTVDEDLWHERLERQFTYEKLFNGGSSAFPWDQRRRALNGWPERPVHPYHGHRRHRGALPRILLPEGHYLRHDDGGDGRVPFEGEAAAAAAQPAPLADAPAPQAAEPQPPDPRGPRWEVARTPGAVPAVGERLPAGRPHVALDAADYDLPAPPPGHGYVRFDGTVLLIESATRVVRQIH